MSFRDETIAKTPGLPLGLYWGVYLGDERKNAWKIDVWAIQPPVYEEFQILKEHLLSRLVPETRTAIMRIKSVVWRHPEYRRAFSSQDVYSAVLDSGIADVNGFWEYLRSKGVLV